MGLFGGGGLSGLFSPHDERNHMSETGTFSADANQNNQKSGGGLLGGVLGNVAGNAVGNNTSGGLKGMIGGGQNQQQSSTAAPTSTIPTTTTTPVANEAENKVGATVAKNAIKVGTKLLKDGGYVHKHGPRDLYEHSLQDYFGKEYPQFIHHAKQEYLNHHPEHRGLPDHHLHHNVMRLVFDAIKKHPEVGPIVGKHIQRRYATGGYVLKELKGIAKDILGSGHKHDNHHYAGGGNVGTGQIAAVGGGAIGGGYAGANIGGSLSKSAFGGAADKYNAQTKAYNDALQNHQAKQKEYVDIKKEHDDYNKAMSDREQQIQAARKSHDEKQNEKERIHNEGRDYGLAAGYGDLGDYKRAEFNPAEHGIGEPLKRPTSILPKAAPGEFKGKKPSTFDSIKGNAANFMVKHGSKIGGLVGAAAGGVAGHYLPGLGTMAGGAAIGDYAAKKSYNSDLAKINSDTTLSPEEKKAAIAKLGSSSSRRMKYAGIGAAGGLAGGEILGVQNTLARNTLGTQPMMPIVRGAISQQGGGGLAGLMSKKSDNNAAANQPAPLTAHQKQMQNTQQQIDLLQKQSELAKLQKANPGLLAKNQQQNAVQPVQNFQNQPEQQNQNAFEQQQQLNYEDMPREYYE